jgi:hypothetical protein
MKSENRLKNEKGSVLAYVLIFGMIILILVAGLATAANNGILFTQKSVESRQAYMDAKSVIEFGKIEINERKQWLDEKNAELKALYDQLAAAIAAEESTSGIQASIDDLKEKIHDCMTASFYIGGNAGDVVSTVTEVSDENAALGVMTVDEQSYTDQSTGEVKTNYVFDIQTQNLRRKLDYQTSLYYKAAEYTDDGNEEPEDLSADWLGTQIKRKNTYQVLQCVINKAGNTKDYSSVNKVLDVSEPDLSLNVGRDKSNPNASNTKFEWWQECTMNLEAKNICFTAPFPSDGNSVYKSEFNITAAEQIRIKENYSQNNQAEVTNTFDAENIVFEGNITLADKSNLVIKCKNLFINGNVTLDAASSGLNIEAENVVIKGNVTLGSYSEVTINAPNVWIDGDLETQAELSKFSAESDFIKIGGAVTVQRNTSIIIDSKQVKINGDTEILAGGAKINIENINYLKTGNIKLATSAELTITGATGESNNVMISDTISPYDNSGTNAYNVSVSNLAYFICNKLYLDNSCKAIISASNFVGFKEEYKQLMGDMTIKDADTVVFGGTLSLNTWGGDSDFYNLDVKANNVYLDTAAVSMKKINKEGLSYYGKDGTSATKLYLKQSVSGWDKTVEAGNYSSVSGNFPKADTDKWLYDLVPTVYTGPVWPDLSATLFSPSEPTKPGSGSGSSGSGTVSGGFITNGSEKYY